MFSIALRLSGFFTSDFVGNSPQHIKPIGRLSGTVVRLCSWCTKVGMRIGVFFFYFLLSVLLLQMNRIYFMLKTCFENLAFEPVDMTFACDVCVRALYAHLDGLYIIK